MRLCTVAVAALALAGCAEQTDIIARLASDAGPPSKLDAGKKYVPLEASAPPFGLNDAGVPQLGLKDGGGPTCGAPSSELLLIAPPYMSRLTLPTTARTTFYSPSCLEQGVKAAAIDETGLLWVNTANPRAAIFPEHEDCVPRQDEEPLDAMTFVFEPKIGRHVLYTLSQRQLHRVEPETFERQLLGEVEATYLVGTRYGELFALRELGSQVSIDAIRVPDIAAESNWLVERPKGAALWGAAAGDGDLILLFETDLYRYSLDTEELALMTSIVETDVADHPVVVSPACGLR